MTLPCCITLRENVHGAFWKEKNIFLIVIFLVSVKILMIHVFSVDALCFPRFREPET